MANNSELASQGKKIGFGTAPVFFTAISTILGAILFLRFGFAVGTLGFWGTLLIILVGHLVTVPTALAISEIATNQKVEGGGEYFIISRSFGLNIGMTIGFALYLSQAISVAFYVIAFTEAFSPLFDWLAKNYEIILPRQVISIPAMLALSALVILKGANLGVRALYVVVAILFTALALFFIGSTDYHNPGGVLDDGFRNMDDFFVVFAIIFPAFTGMTAGVGLSGDLKNPARSIPLGTLSATLSGMVIYVLVIWKLAISASPDELLSDQLIMRQIALFGNFAIPIGLAASTISSAIGSVLVAPRTLQALALDKAFPALKVNRFLQEGIGPMNEPRNASIITCAIALLFVALGDVDAVASIITMFFMVTYGSICLISFLYHFGADPSYRPVFKSRWYISMIGFLMCVWLMFKINTVYAIMAGIIMTALYAMIHHYHRERGGLEDIFQGALFQLTRKLQLFLQQSEKSSREEKWRPAVICINRDTFERQNAFLMLTWIAYRYGFAVYIHLIEGYYSSKTHKDAEKIMDKLINLAEETHSNVYVDTLISPSFTTAIAQAIQLPSVTGKENNLILYEFPRRNPERASEFIENLGLMRAGEFDICMLATSDRIQVVRKELHIWLTPKDMTNAGLMIMLGYIILAHPDWEEGIIRVFYVCPKEEMIERKKEFHTTIREGRLPIAPRNVRFIEDDPNRNFKSLVNKHSADASLLFIGFIDEQVKTLGPAMFEGYDHVGDILFISAFKEHKII